MAHKPRLQFELASLVLLTLLTATALGAFGLWGFLALLVVVPIVIWARTEPPSKKRSDEATPEAEAAENSTAENRAAENSEAEHVEDTLEGPVGDTADSSDEATTDADLDVVPAKPSFRVLVPFRKGVAGLLLFSIAGVLIFAFVLKDSLTNSMLQYSKKPLIRAAALLRDYCEANGHLPPAIVTDATGNPPYSWRVLVAARDSSSGYHFSEPWNGPNNYALPNPLGDPGYAVRWTNAADVLAITGSQTAWATDDSGEVKPVPKDREKSTIILIMYGTTGVHWAEPFDLMFEQAQVMPAWLKRWASTSGASIGIDVAFADGSVATISPDIPQDVWEALLSPNGPPPDFERYILRRFKFSDWLAPVLFGITAMVMLFRPQRKPPSGETLNVQAERTAALSQKSLLGEPSTKEHQVGGDEQPHS
jgi:hypothetical protein